MMVPKILRDNICRIQILFVILLVGSFCIPATAAEIKDFVGNWNLVPARSSDVNAAIEKTLAEENFVTRSLARGKLQGNNKLPLTISISVAKDQAAISFDGAKGRVAPLNGSQVAWSRGDGETYQVGMAMEGSVLVETIQGKQGAHKNRYTLSLDGKNMVVDVFVTSPRLKSPLMYQIYLSRN